MYAYVFNKFDFRLIYFIYHLFFYKERNRPFFLPAFDSEMYIYIYIYIYSFIKDGTLLKGMILYKKIYKIYTHIHH